MLRIAITTPTGNIGRELTRILQSETDHHLTLLARDPSKLEAEAERGATVKQGDLLDSDFVQEATRGADALLFLIPPHFGAHDFRGFQNQITTIGVDAANRIGSATWSSFPASAPSTAKASAPSTGSTTPRSPSATPTAS